MTTKDKKKVAIQNMVEALIKSDPDKAAEELHKYLQLKTRELVLGETTDEEKNEKSKKKPDKDKNGIPDWINKKSDKKSDDDNDDDDDDDDDDDKKSKKSKKKGDDEDKVSESVGPKANLTKSRGPEFHSNAPRGNIEGNVYKSKPKKSNDTKSRGPEFADESGKGKITGNSLKKTPHKENLTKAKKAPTLEPQKGKVANCDDGRDYEFGTGNV